MRAQHQRTGIARGKTLLHQPGPQQPGGPQLGRLHEEVHADPEEEAQPRSELVHVQAGVYGRADVFQAVGQRIAQLLHRRGAGLQHVVAGNRNGIESRHVAGAEGDDVAHDPHGGRRRIDIGVADHEFLENVVLHGPGQVPETGALLFRRHDVHRHDRQHRPVHGHGNRHVLKRNAVEQALHVLDGIDGHPGLADIAQRSRVVRVVAAVRRQVEGDAQTRLAGGDVAPVERVRLLGGGKARVLAHGPWPVGIHGGPRPAHEGRRAGQAARVFKVLEIFDRVQRLDRDPFGRIPDQARGVGALELLLGTGRPIRRQGAVRCVRVARFHWEIQRC